MSHTIASPTASVAIASAPSRGEVIGIVACVAAPVLTGLLAVALGQDANWDLRNYHWYNAHAALTGRHGIDLAPAHTPTYFNPLLDILLYQLAHAVPARVVGFVLGLIQGLNFIAIFLIAKELIPVRVKLWREGVCALVATVGLLGGGHLGLIGTTFFDNVVCIPVLMGLWVALRAMRDGAGVPGRDRILPFLFAGALVGLGTGLKLTAAIFGLGFCAALLFLGGSIRERLVRTMAGGVGALVGLAATGGWWMAHLYATTGNPLFPLLNDIFRSPMALPDAYRDTQFVPHSVLEALAYPFLLGVTPRIAGEIEFTDFRIAVLAVVGLATAGLGFAGRLRPVHVAEPRGLGFIGAFSLVSFLAWLGVFAIYRYVVALEMLAPALIVTCILQWPVAERVKPGLCMAVLAGLALTTRPGDWGHVPWSRDFVELHAPAFDPAESGMVLLTGYSPTAWVVGAFPDTWPLVRVNGFSFGPDDGDIGQAGIARRRVSGHTGPLFLLSDQAEMAPAAEVLARYGLEPDMTACHSIDSNLSHGIKLCSVTRMKDQR